VEISKDPAEMAANNVDLQPGDTVVVPKAGIVYVLGEVTRPGGYVLNSTGGIAVLQVVAAAGAPTHVASPGKTRLLRRTETGFQKQGANLKKLLRGQVRDVAVHDQDIVFIPTSGVKSALNASALVATAGAAAIYLFLSRRSFTVRKLWEVGGGNKASNPIQSAARAHYHVEDVQDVHDVHDVHQRAHNPRYDTVSTLLRSFAIAPLGGGTKRFSCCSYEARLLAVPTNPPEPFLLALLISPPESLVNVFG